jgi:glucose/arabinose dehydrogenase
MRGTVIVQGGTANVAPAVALVSPTNEASFVAGTPLTLQATASDSDGTVSQVEFFDGASLLGADTTGPDYRLTTTLYTGVHVLTAVATDNEGARTTSATVTNTGRTEPIANPLAERVAKGDVTVELQTVADGLAAPIGMAVPDDNSGRMFVYDQEGRIWNVTGAGRQPVPVLDLRSRLVVLGVYDERGLLGLAVHPNFAQNPLLYTYTSEPYAGAADFASGLGTSNNHQSVVAEWRMSASDTNVVEVASRREVLRLDQPQANHNGGTMHFGPEGMLYLVLGDGGQANDVAPGHVPGGNAQDLERIWGKLLRIDVDGPNSANGRYGIPSDNPRVGAPGLDEIWAWGLRNPFSFGFERGTGALYLADVGQNNMEEIDLITRGGNYGWNIKEGTFYFDAADGNIVSAPVRPVPPGLVDPIAQYDHDDGLAIIGGHVYHGTALPALAGRFVFGDWGSFGAPSGRLFYLDATNGVKELRLGAEDRPLGYWLKGFGEDTAGELYLMASNSLGPDGNTGRVLKLVSLPVPARVTDVSLGPSGGTVALSWSAEVGRRYQVEFNPLLNQGPWTALGGVITATQSTMSSADVTGPDGQRYYRIVSLP